MTTEPLLSEIADRAKIAALTGQKVVADFWMKPIPDRRFDYSAVLDNYDGAEDSRCPIGHGATEVEAIEDLLIEVEARP